MTSEQPVASSPGRPAAGNLLKTAGRFDRLLRRTCEAIVANARSGRAISPAAGWLLENYSFLCAQARELRESMPRGFYRRLPRTVTGTPVIYSAADQAIDQLTCLDTASLRGFFEKWQERSMLKLAELWAIGPMLRIALLDRLSSATQSGPLESERAETAIRQSIIGLRSLSDVMWPELVESLSAIDRILRKDPAGAYESMDYETRDRYRRQVEDLAKRSDLGECEVAGLALELARPSGQHVGYFLFGQGLKELRRTAQSRRTFAILAGDVLRAIPLFVYLGGICLVGWALLWGIERWTGRLPWWFVLVLSIPVSQTAIAVVNLLVSRLVSPELLPRMDFRNGIPPEARTFVVVPSLLLNRQSVERLVENLEICYLANRSRNLLFGLLTDFPDATTERAGKNELLDFCVTRIVDLNRRYRDEGSGPFYLFHRDHEYNESEGTWMGRERKRGKLEDFNDLLLGEDNAFATIIGDLSRIGRVRYVITLDSDTRLPRDTAWKLAGTMAHPLNRPEFDERTGIVKAGYGILQPRIGISMESAVRSHLAAIYSGQTGFDPYTRAVSDVYQDLFGRATFTGKGIYDVDAFTRATRNRFPDNTLLSHDLIEGEHARTGMVTDQELIDDYPAKYQAFAKRKHRWARGDWQIAMWLLPRVPDKDWNWIKNPLPHSSRWKILDNLRRSLVEPALFALLLCAWMFLGAAAVRTTISLVALLLVPAYAEFAIACLRPPPVRFLRAWIWTRLSDFWSAHLDAALTLVFLPAQGLLMVDAIVRTLYRRFISQRHLLEWESMAQSEMAGAAPFCLRTLANLTMLREALSSMSLPERFLAASTVVALVLWISIARPWTTAHPFVFLLLFTWMLAPLAVAWLNSGEKHPKALADADRKFLRSVTLATWRYFEDFSRPDENWIVPDNVQEDPPAVARRTSPTNIGLQLNAAIAAHEFGYVTHGETVERIRRMQSSLGRLERHRGHLFNWYNTQTLEVLSPRFVSTVDSGNLAAALIVTRQACKALFDGALVTPSVLHGLMDHLERLRDSIPAPARTTSIVRLFDSLRRQLETAPDDLFFWEGVLSEVCALAERMKEHVNWSEQKLRSGAPDQAAQVRFWMDRLSDRARAALQELCDLAPWLCSPFEAELRLNLNNPQLEFLMERLRRIPRIKELGAVYEEIDREIARIERNSRQVHRSAIEKLQELRLALTQARTRWQTLKSELNAEAAISGRLYKEMDFSFLFDDRRQLFHIGWNEERKQLEPSYYDLLASEARTAVFIAIAKGDTPREAWFHLGRKLTHYRGHRTLVSWSGTMFEYLMPALFMKTWDSTLLGESLRSVVRIQRLYARERRVPWGISESAHSGRDGTLNYQYRAFGVPCCASQRVQPDDLVIAPYAGVLSVMVDAAAATENLRNMASRGWLARYGFYEAVDFRSRGGHRRAEVIRAFMAHHQGMSLLALCNALLDDPIRKLFHSAPSVAATELLLHERVPVMAEAAGAEEPLLQGLGNLSGAAEDRTPHLAEASEVGVAQTE